MITKGESLMEKSYDFYAKINKGWSNDDKYHVKTKGKDYLLRISLIELLPVVKRLADITRKLEGLGVL